MAIRAVFEVVRCGYLQSAVLRLALPSAQSLESLAVAQEKKAALAATRSFSV